jgi:serine/threonine protein phosphatase PrpC
MNEKGIDFQTCFLSDSGIFIKNKGCFVYRELKNFAFWLVVDGVDFIPSQTSAELVSNQLCQDLVKQATLSRKKIRDSLFQADQVLKAESTDLSLKASLALVVTDYSEIIWAISGNSRLYLIRGNQVLFRSKDQSVAQSLFESGTITEDEMATVSERNSLTNYVGMEVGFNPLISKRFKLHEGDRLLLCNLGFWEQIRGHNLRRLLEVNLEEAPLMLRAFQETFFNQEAHVLNNYLVGLVTVNRVLNKRISRRLRPNYQQIAAMIALILVAGAFYIRYALRQKTVVRENRRQITRQNTFPESEKRDEGLVWEVNEIEKKIAKSKEASCPQRRPDSGTAGSSVTTIESVTVKEKTEIVPAKPNKPHQSSLQPSEKPSTKPVLVSAESKETSQALQLIKQGDQLAEKNQFRDAVHCYKKAKTMYSKLAMPDQTAQLDMKIDAVRREMRQNFKGAR